MSGSTLYDEDILRWSEQQAEIIRRLGSARRDLPKDLDIENVAEEIESVGRSELAAVESFLELILVHLIKLATEPDAAAARHWRAEIFGFHGGMWRRYSPSMKQRIDLDLLWRRACEQMLLASEGPQHAAIAGLPEASPFMLDAFLGERLDADRLAGRLGGRASDPA